MKTLTEQIQEMCKLPIPDLSGADLNRADLSGANLSGNREIVIP